MRHNLPAIRKGALGEGRQLAFPAAADAVICVLVLSNTLVGLYPPLGWGNLHMVLCSRAREVLAGRSVHGIYMAGWQVNNTSRYSPRRLRSALVVPNAPLYICDLNGGVSTRSGPNSPLVAAARTPRLTSSLIAFATHQGPHAAPTLAMKGGVRVHLSNSERGRASSVDAATETVATGDERAHVLKFSPLL